MIKRDKYLTQLISAKNNGFPKVITGVRRCGKSFLLKEIYREYLLSDNVPENRIIILELDDDKNSNYRDPLELGAYIREKCKDKENYYVFIDEIQKVYSIINPNLTDGKHVLANSDDTEVISFVDVVLGLSREKN
ncbi:MAG: AAA family ATPase, partial [[Clostridium] aminophilum]